MKKYWYLIVLPAALFLLGAACNQVVIFANHGLMPVSWPGGCSVYPKDPDHRDPVHVCMTKASHLRPLADWIKSSDAVSSPGDYIMDAAQVFLEPFLILWIILTTIDFIKYGKNDSTL